jgi:hypothetical protein
MADSAAKETLTAESGGDWALKLTTWVCVAHLCGVLDTPMPRGTEFVGEVALR